jgi:hypothetical protein
MLSTEQDPSQKKFYQQHLLFLQDRMKIAEYRLRIEDRRISNKVKKGNRMAIFTLMLCRSEISIPEISYTTTRIISPLSLQSGAFCESSRRTHQSVESFWSKYKCGHE